MKVGRYSLDVFGDSPPFHMRPEKLRRLMASIKANSYKHIKLRDKAAFVLGTLNLCLYSYVLGASPQRFPELYSYYAVVLFLLRLINYRLERQHYFLYDFCYFANVMLLAYLWLLPQNGLFFNVLFVYTSGPLALSIIAFRNSLVFHSLDKMTSVFMHLSPALVTWSLRWFPPAPTAPSGGTLEWDVRVAAAVALPYLCWLLAYALKLFVFSAGKIRQRSYMTLYTFIINDQHGWLGRAVTAAGPKYSPLMYIAIHLALTAASCASTALWHASFAAHSGYLLGVIVWSAFNGANYYFEVFARRYIESLNAMLAPSSSANKAPEANQRKAEPDVAKAAEHAHSVVDKKLQ
eukprot:jgi/Mesvir1/1741/Mv21192-RA.1